MKSKRDVATNNTRPLATAAEGKPRTFTLNGENAQAKSAAEHDLAYIGAANHHRDKVINFLQLYDGRAGLRMLMNLPDVANGGIAEDCFPIGTTFTAAASANNQLITREIPVYPADSAR